MKRLVGIDYGRKRLGIAFTDPAGLTVQGQPTVVVSGFRDALKQVAEAIVGSEAGCIVLGLPLNMDGTRGEMAEEVERFGQALSERSGVKVAYWDERLTSEQAKRIVSGQKRKERGDIDRVAAALMLESYLSANPI